MVSHMDSQQIDNVSKDELIAALQKLDKWEYLDVIKAVGATKKRARRVVGITSCKSRAIIRGIRGHVRMIEKHIMTLSSPDVFVSKRTQSDVADAITRVKNIDLSGVKSLVDSRN